METEKNKNTAEKKAAVLRADGAKKTVIIVGASSGIGYETALRLIGRGFTVVNISRTPCSMQRVKNYAADVTVGDTLEKAVAEAVKAAGGLYALVYLSLIHI